MKKSHLLTLGECMLELRANSSGTASSGFAGDTYNTAVYAKRASTSLHVNFVTCLGNDPFSHQLIQMMENEGLSSRWTFQTSQAPVGIYAIETDATGERSFHYWRKGSAATYLLGELNQEEFVQELGEESVIFFSGISVAILSEQDRSGLIKLLERVKTNGVTIAFDPNYRPKLWSSSSDAQHWMSRCFAISDIVLPGLDEMEALFELNSEHACFTYFAQYPIREVVLKAGANGTTVSTENTRVHKPFTPAPCQVDSTAAGDSFAGTYLALRSEGNNIQTSLDKAADVASIVVQHKGAIIDKHLLASV